MDPKELVKLVDILNPNNKPGRITVIVRMGAENMRVKLSPLIKAVRQAGQVVTWVCDPMHGNTIKAPSGLKTRPFDSILVSAFSFNNYSLFRCCQYLVFVFLSFFPLFFVILGRFVNSVSKEYLWDMVLVFPRV